jgi:hypothetical protein
MRLSLHGLLLRSQNDSLCVYIETWNRQQGGGVRPKKDWRRASAGWRVPGIVGFHEIYEGTQGSG